MRALRCPAGDHPLGLRLLPDAPGHFWCLTCDRPIAPDTLVSLGLPAPLVARVDPWQRRVMKLTGTGYMGELGEGLSDQEFATRFDALRRETAELVRDLSAHLPARAEVDLDVFLKRPAEEWTPEVIVRWRERQVRLREIQLYGAEMAGHEFARLRSATETLAAMERLMPSAFDEDERRRFRWGYGMSLHIFGRAEHASCDEERRLARMLGLE
jgi:hypothetical protein